MLEEFPQSNLNWNTKMQQFEASEIMILQCIISCESLSMKSHCISTIQGWPTPKSNRDLQGNVGFINFNQWLILYYIIVTAPISHSLNGWTSNWELIRMVEHTFEKPKQAFPAAQTYQHFTPTKPNFLLTDISSITMARILSQYDGFCVFRPEIFYSHKSSPPITNNDT